MSVILFQNSFKKSILEENDALFLTTNKLQHASTTDSSALKGRHLLKEGQRPFGLELSSPNSSSQTPPNPENVPSSLPGETCAAHPFYPGVRATYKKCARG